MALVHVVAILLQVSIDTSGWLSTLFLLFRMDVFN